MYYMISMRNLPDELIREIQVYLPRALLDAFLFIDKNDLNLHSSYLHLFNEEIEPIDIEKLKEILVLKRLKG